MFNAMLESPYLIDAAPALALKKHLQKFRNQLDQKMMDQEDQEDEEDFEEEQLEEDFDHQNDDHDH